VVSVPDHAEHLVFPASLANYIDFVSDAGPSGGRDGWTVSQKKIHRTILQNRALHQNRNSVTISVN